MFELFGMMLFDKVNWFEEFLVKLSICVDSLFLFLVQLDIDGVMVVGDIVLLIGDNCGGCLLVVVMDGI